MAWAKLTQEPVVEEGGKKALDFTWESCAASLKLDAYPWDASVPTDIMNRDF